MAEENKELNAADLSSLGSFDFTPDWAKAKPDDKSKFARFEERGERNERRERPERRERREERPPRENFKRDERRAPQRRNEERAPRQFIKPMDAEVRILPAQNELGPIIRKIQTSHCAYPLKKLAYFFLEHPAACVLRVTPNKVDGAAEVAFYQCKACGFVAFSEDELVQHILAAHLGDYYDAKEIECEPPKGAFNCVAKCGITGELLGPPNLHGFDALVRERVRTRFANMSELEYRSRIEMVRDSESVEAWRATATKKTVYLPKVTEPTAPVAEGEEAPAPVELEREQAEMEFRRNVLPGLMNITNKSVDITAEQALKVTNKPFLFACRDALRQEQRRPASLFYALRGAFHHRKLAFFRANDPRGPEFVVSVIGQALDKAHAIPELAAIVEFVESKGLTSRGEIVEALAKNDDAKKAEILTHLNWLAEKGHLVEFFDGVISTPSANPKYMPFRAKRLATKPAEAEAVAPAPVAEPAPVEASAPAAEAAPAETPAVTEKDEQ